jgi:hypothetical protein
MQPLGTFDLVLHFLVVIVMPLLMWANLRNVASTSPMNQYLWRENPNFMRLSLVILGLLTVFSAITLLEHYGVLSHEFAATAGLVIGIPFLVAAVGEIWLGIVVLRKYLATGAAGRSGA